MALLQYKAPVQYSAQQDIFKDFLQNFKSFESASESAATDAIEDLNIDEDADYDFMDDEETNGNGQGTTNRRQRTPKLKYMKILQDVADRAKSNIVIELDDLDTVRIRHHSEALLREVSLM